MALKANITLNIGIPINNTYTRIDTVSGYKGGIDMSVNVYISREAFLNSQGYLEQRRYSFIPSVEVGSENFIKQGYEYLKTLPEFENATNIPENGSPD